MLKRTYMKKKHNAQEIFPKQKMLQYFPNVTLEQTLRLPRPLEKGYIRQVANGLILFGSP